MKFEKSLMITLCLIVLLEASIILLKTRHDFSPTKVDLREGYLACLDHNKNPKEKGQCLKKLAINALKNYSTAEMETTLKGITDSSKRQWCHEFMHYVGWGLYQKTNNMFDAFSQAKHECDSGMYHGIVEEYINETQRNYNQEKFTQIITTSCEEGFSSQNIPSGMKALCYHGLGHAFMLITENDLNRSLNYCDYVLTSYVPACYTGAFMENTLSKQVGRSSDHPSKFTYNPNVPDYPCDSLDEKYKDQCYVYKGTSNVVLTHGDFKQAFKDCLKVSAKYQDECFWGVGSDIPGPHWRTQIAAEKCKLALDISPRAYEQCIYGAMSFVVQLNLGNPKEAVEFCNFIDQNYQDTCYRAAGISLGGWATAGESLDKKCASFKNLKAQSLCQHPVQSKYSFL